MNKIFLIPIFIISLGFLIWFILPIINYGILNPGNILGIVLCLYLMLWSGLNTKYVEIKHSLCSHQAVQILWRIFNVCAGVFIAYAVIVSVLMVCTAFFSPPAGNSTAVVLGAQVKPWGPSALLQQRIDAAADFLKENPESAAVVSGGQGKDEPMSEAQSMYENIVKQGVDGSRIYKEDKSVNTKQNIKFSHRIIKENNLNEDITIITDSFHQLRARIIANKLKIRSKISSVNSVNHKIGIICYPTFFVREWIAIPFEFFK